MPKMEKDKEVQDKRLVFSVSRPLYVTLPPGILATAV